MKPLLKITAILLILILFFIPGRTQSISGDTIYVNTQVEVAILFPTMPSTFYTNPKDAPYNFKTLTNGFTVSAKIKNAKPAPLFVTEGKRNHVFLLMYKKDINYRNVEETNFDYSTVQKLEDHIRQSSRQQEKTQQFNTLKAQARANFDAGKYQDALDGYNQALALFPKDAECTRQVKKLNKLIKKAGGNKTNSPEKTVDPATTVNSGIYTPEELKTRYPDIDFSTPPSAQQLYLNKFDPAKNTKNFSKFLSEPDNLNISTGKKDITLTGKGIYRKDNVVYFKLLVQNNSKKDFLCGAFALHWQQKSSGELLGLYPVCLYPAGFPVLKPAGEITVFYVFEQASISNEDVLTFILYDRLEKIKLSFSFKGDRYKQVLGL